MDSVFKKVSNFMLYGREDAHTYKLIEPRMDRSNRKLWTIIAGAGVLIFLALVIFSFFVESLKPQQLIYSIMLGLYLVCFLILLLLKQKKYAKFIVQFLMIALYALAVLLANYGDLSINAVTVMVVIIIVPITYAGHPYRIYILTILTAIGEIVSAALIKTGNIRSMDITNSIIFSVISLGINSYLLSERIHTFANNNLLEKMAYIDSLTGLDNEFSYLEKKEKMDKEISEGTNPIFGVAMFDVNNLKKTNDTYGHIYGCSLVVESGHYIRSLFKTSYCFHIGGDEFMVIFKGEDDLNRIEQIFADFDKSMDDYYITKNNIKLRLTIARGYSMFNAETDKCFADVLARADKLMYENKVEEKKKYNLAER